MWLESTSGSRIPINDHCSIGRARTNSVPVTCEKVSRRHALVYRDEEGQCLVIDLGSSNGTYLNGQRITHLGSVKVGDLIEIGSHRFILRSTSGEQTGPSELNARQAIATGAELAACWLLIGDKENSDSRQGEDTPAYDCFKTMVNWMHMGERIVERHHGCVPDPANDKLFAYWRDPNGDSSIASSVAHAMKDLQAIQAKQRPSEFRLALHFGMVVIGAAGPGRKKSLIGTELNFTFHMQKLAWTLATPCLVSEEANRRLAALLPTQPLEPCGLRGYEGNYRFFSL